MSTDARCSTMLTGCSDVHARDSHNDGIRESRSDCGRNSRSRSNRRYHSRSRSHSRSPSPSRIGQNRHRSRSRSKLGSSSRNHYRDYSHSPSESPKRNRISNPQNLQGSSSSGNFTPRASRHEQERDNRNRGPYSYHRAHLQEELAQASPRELQKNLLPKGLVLEPRMC